MSRLPHAASRREFLKNTGRIAAASALAGAVIPHVHAAEDNTIRLALIGCGGRGTGAAVNALSVADQSPIKLIAMADVFAKRLKSSSEQLSQMKEYAGKIDVPEDRKFIGFDAYRQAMDCLKPGDVVILGTPPAFRWPHFSYAIEKRLNVFMEKPITVDGPTTRRMLALGEESVKRNLKVGVGLMFRHAKDRIELHDRVRSGAIGDIIMMRAYRMHGLIGYFASPPKPEGISDLLYQVQRFHSFIWSGGGCFSDFYIHNIDECCWMKDAWPIKAQALGGRHYRGDAVDQNFDTYSVEYTFADGTKLFFDGRTMPGCHEEFASFAHGSKGCATLSIGGNSMNKSRIFKGQTFRNAETAWKCRTAAESPYDLEWSDLIAAIRQDKPYNEVKRGAEASLVTSMGRMAAHTGQMITYDQILNSDHEFAPDVDKLTMDSPAPLPAGPDGKYPVPQPGIVTKREY
jgi:predicted dehydrogenase